LFGKLDFVWKFLLGFSICPSLIIVWISLFLCLDFPDSLKNPENTNKKSVFVLFGFRRFHNWISPVLRKKFKTGEIKTKTKNCFDFTGFEFFASTIHFPDFRKNPGNLNTKTEKY
jgi:hypothetical protein